MRPLTMLPRPLTIKGPPSVHALCTAGLIESTRTLNPSVVRYAMTNDVVFPGFRHPLASDCNICQVKRGKTKEDGRNELKVRLRFAAALQLGPRHCEPAHASGCAAKIREPPIDRR